MTKRPSSKLEKPTSTIKLVSCLSLLLGLTLLYQDNNYSILDDDNRNGGQPRHHQQRTPPSSFHMRSENRGDREDGSHESTDRALVTVLDDKTTAAAAGAGARATMHNNRGTAPSMATADDTEKSTTRPRLFTCGFELWDFRRQLFDDLEYAGRFGEEAPDVRVPGAGDVLLQGGLNGPCNKSPTAEFPGKILFVHSEARTVADGGSDPADVEKYRQSDRFFQLGPSSTPSERALPEVTFGAVYFASTTTPEQRRRLVGGPASSSSRPEAEDPRDAMVHVANRCGTFRTEAAVEISSSVDGLAVHQNPKCRRFTDRFLPVPKQDWKPRSSYKDNWKLYGKYKYCLVMENTPAPNYVTEKLFMAFLGGCLPVYWGSEGVFRMFNRDAFVFYDRDRPDRAIAQMRHLQINGTAYREMMSQPILAPGRDAAESYLSLTKDVGDGRLRSRIRTMLGLADA